RLRGLCRCESCGIWISSLDRRRHEPVDGGDCILTCLGARGFWLEKGELVPRRVGRALYLYRLCRGGSPEGARLRREFRALARAAQRANCRAPLAAHANALE